MLGTTLFSTVTNADSTTADIGAVAALHATCNAAGSFELTVVAHHVVRLMTTVIQNAALSLTCLTIA